MFYTVRIHTNKKVKNKFKKNAGPHAPMPLLLRLKITIRDGKMLREKKKYLKKL
jgi:hypothetical protein